MDGINQPSRMGNFEQIVMMNLIFMINHFNLKYFENLNDSIKILYTGIRSGLFLLNFSKKFM